MSFFFAESHDDLELAAIDVPRPGEPGTMIPKSIHFCEVTRYPLVNIQKPILKIAHLVRGFTNDLPIKKLWIFP